MLIVKLTDGYHTPQYYFEDGTFIYEDDETIIHFLCKPHEVEYSFITIYFDDIECDSDDFITLANFQSMNAYERLINFSMLSDIHKKYYEEVIE